MQERHNGPIDENPGSASSESIYRTLVENATDMLVLAGPNWQRVYVSPACTEIVGYASDDLLGQTPYKIIHPDDAAAVAATFVGLTPEAPTASAVWRCLRPDGTYRWLESTYRRIADGRIVGVVRDIQQRKDIEDQLAAALSRLEKLAMQDPLTGIANRRAFIDELESRVAGITPAEHVAVLLIDLDGFKPVNDRYGHAVGDEVLTAAAQRLLDIAAATDPVHGCKVARLGGDEFAVLLAKVPVAIVEHTACAIVNTLLMPFISNGLRIEISASVGVSHSNSHDTKGILLRADLAMYEAKHRGGAGYCVFETIQPFALILSASNLRKLDCESEWKRPS